MEKVKKRGKNPTENEKATFITDGNEQYTNALSENFDEKTINYGQVIKIRENGKVVGKLRITVFGDVDGLIDTVYIERYNLTARLN